MKPDEKPPTDTSEKIHSELVALNTHLGVHKKEPQHIVTVVRDDSRSLALLYGMFVLLFGIWWMLRRRA